MFIHFAKRDTAFFELRRAVLTRLGLRLLSHRLGMSRAVYRQRDARWQHIELEGGQRHHEGEERVRMEGAHQMELDQDAETIQPIINIHVVVAL